MNEFLGFLYLLLFFWLLIALINPQYAIRWGTKKTRGWAILYFIGAFFLIAFIGAPLTDSSSPESAQSEKAAAVTTTRPPKVSQDFYVELGEHMSKLEDDATVWKIDQLLVIAGAAKPEDLDGVQKKNLEEWTSQLRDARVKAQARQEANRSSSATQQPAAPAPMQDPYADAESVIARHCSEEWPEDYSMRSYCQGEQRKAVRQLQRGKPSDIGDREFMVIRPYCEGEWPFDYSMRAYCEGEQFKAVRQLARGAAPGLSQEAFARIRTNCTREWPRDYAMRVYCEDQQVNAYLDLQ